jgi:hypothetical protein
VIVARVFIDSITLGELLVAIGTIGLAAFTCWLGWSTRSSARAARDAVELVEVPFVIGMPNDGDYDSDRVRPRRSEGPIPKGVKPPGRIHRVRDDDGSHFIRIMLWNIGHGPAIVENVTLTAPAKSRQPGSPSGPDETYVDRFGAFSPLGAGMSADVEVPSPAWPASSRAATLTVVYRHANGERYETRSAAKIEDRFVDCVTYDRGRLGRPKPG